MKKINNKGFTLVEIIIAIGILSIVLALGYNIILATDKASKKQTEVFSEQQTANLINKYLTNDLEQLRKFKEVEETQNEEGQKIYSYILNEGMEDTEEVTYEVSKTQDEKFYDLTRRTNNGSIELISSAATNSDIPFSISRVSGSNNTFNVALKEKDKDIAKYSFDVTSRVTDDVISTQPSDIDGNISGEFKLSYFYQKNGDKDFWVKLFENLIAFIRGENSFFEFIRDLIKDLLFPGDKDGNKHMMLTATAIKKLNNENNDDTQYYIERKLFDKKGSYIFDLQIPINSSNLQASLLNEQNENQVLLGQKGKVLGCDGKGDHKGICTKDDCFKWSIFKNELNNKKIYIYKTEGITIESILINKETITKENIGKYEIGIDKYKEDIDVRIIMNIDENFNSKNSNNYNEQSITIGFGEYSQ